MITSPCDYFNKIRSDLRLGLTVRSFSELSPKLLLSMKEDLALSMSVEELAFCQSYYRNPPLLDELYFLDGIAAGNHKRLRNAVLQNDFSGAEEETDRDLISKLKSGSRRYSKFPVTLSDRLCALSNALDRSGKPNPFRGTEYAADLYTALSYAAVGYIPRDILSVKGTDSAIRIFAGDPAYKHRLQSEAAENDTILLIPYRGTPKSNAERLSSINIELLSLLSRSKSYRSLVRAVRVVDERGVAVALASLSRGIFIDLADLPSVFDDGELYDLSHAEIGAVLLAAPPNSVDRLRALTLEFGLESFPIARAVHGQNLTVRRSARSPFAFRSDFLLSLANRGFTPDKDPVSKPPSEETETVVCRQLERNVTSAALSASSSMCDPDSVFWGRVFTASMTSDNTFLSGAYTALSAVSEAVLMGGRCDSVVAYEICSSPTSVSSLSRSNDHALGVYRTLAELSVVGSPSFLHAESEKEAYSAVYCHASASSPAPMKAFRTPSSHVYLIAPRVEASGLPNYDDVRSILRHFEELNQSESILSASVGYKTSPQSVIDAMTSDLSFSYDAPTRAEAALQTRSGIFYIIETKFPIAGLSHLGVTMVKPEEASEEAPESSVPKEDRTLRRGSAPTVWLYPQTESVNLYALAVSFMKNGFSVRITTDLLSDLSKSRPDILFLCGDSEELSDRIEARFRLPRFDHSIRSLLSEDRLVLLPCGVSASLNDQQTLYYREPSDLDQSGIYCCDPLTDTMIRALYQFFRETV